MPERHDGAPPSPPDRAAEAGPLALVTRFRHDSTLAGAPVEVIAWRRPDLVVRRTDYAAFVVDERLLTRAFPWRRAPGRVAALFVCEGRVAFPELVLERGDAARIAPAHHATGAFHHARFLDVEWSVPPGEVPEAPRPLGRADPRALDALDAATREISADARAVYAAALALLDASGAPSPRVDLDAADDRPTARDVRIARAIEAQLASLATRANTDHLAELAGLSPRQLQRVLAEFGQRYGVHVESWRDLRNRWRVQIAVVLLGTPGVKVADVAREVGYTSPRALARALAHAGFPAPSEIASRA